MPTEEYQNQPSAENKLKDAPRDLHQEWPSYQAVVRAHHPEEQRRMETVKRAGRIIEVVLQDLMGDDDTSFWPPPDELED